MKPAAPKPTTAEAENTRKTLVKVLIALPVALVFFLGWVTYQSAAETSAAYRWLVRSQEVISSMMDTLTLVTEAETGQRGFVLTGREDYLTPYIGAAAKVDTNVVRLGALLSDNPEQQQRLQRLAPLVLARLALIDQVVNLRRTRGFDAAMEVILTDRGKNQMDAIRQVMSEMKAAELRLLERHQRESARKARNNLAFCGLLIIGDLGFLAWIIILLRRIERMKNLVTVCAWTNKIQHDGRWVTMDEYFKERFKLSITHGISEEAAEKFKRELKSEAPPSSRNP